MKLYMVPLAPNPTKVMLYIAEREALGLQLGIEQVVVNTVKGRHKEPAHLARNPFGTVPVLELDDGSFLLESLAIIEYLEDRYPDGGLLGRTPEERAHARDIERVVDVRLCTPLGAFAHATKSPLGRPPDAAQAAKALEIAQPPLAYLESLLADGHPYICGAAVSVADCTLQASLQLLRYIGEDVLQGRPRLQAWDTRVRARPAAQAVLRW